MVYNTSQNIIETLNQHIMMIDASERDLRKKLPLKDPGKKKETKITNTLKTEYISKKRKPLSNNWVDVFD